MQCGWLKSMDGAAVRYPMLRNDASGPEIGLLGRILAGLPPGKHRNRLPGRPSAGRKGRLRCFHGSRPARNRPGSPISGPEARNIVRENAKISSCLQSLRHFRLNLFCPKRGNRHETVL